MPAATYDFTIEQGIPLSKTILLKNSNDTVKDLTGFTAKMQLKPYTSSSTVILELSTANSKISINTGTGAVTMIFSYSDTELLTYSESVYDLVLIKGSETFKALQGKITVIPKVTTWQT